MVGDGHAMGVAGQVVKDVFGSAKGLLGIDDPVLLKERAQKGRGGLFVVERKALAVERELVVAKSASQSGNEPSKCVAKQCRSVCGPSFLWMPARVAAARQTFHTVLSEMGCSTPGALLLLGNR